VALKLSSHLCDGNVGTTAQQPSSAKRDCRVVAMESSVQLRLLELFVLGRGGTSWFTEGPCDTNLEGGRGWSRGGLWMFSGPGKETIFIWGSAPGKMSAFRVKRMEAAGGEIRQAPPGGRVVGLIVREKWTDGTD